MDSPPRVLLLIESSRSYGRGCLRGVAAYLRLHGPWDVVHLERGLEESLPENVRRFKGDGVIARLETRAMLRAVERLGMPTVDLRGRFESDRVAAFNTDSEKCAELAAEHFLARGFCNFAFCGFPVVDFSEQRGAAFFAEMKRRCHRVEVYDTACKLPRSADTLSAEAYGEFDLERVANWLESLPKPVAVFACNDVRGRQVLAASSAAGLQVPDEIAVLGVDNDEVICDLSCPSLSSIEPDTHRIGFLGATALTELMERRTLTIGGLGQIHQVVPVRIHSRRSTDVLAVDDRIVAAAMRYIRDHAAQGISVKHVAAHVDVSRATLERRFLQSIDRAPAREIERVRMQRVRWLLETTDANLATIAARAGFATVPHLVTAFKRLHGTTPGQYRRMLIRS